MKLCITSHVALFSVTLGTRTHEQDLIVMSFIAEMEPLGKFITSSNLKLVVHYDWWMMSHCINVYLTFATHNKTFKCCSGETFASIHFSMWALIVNWSTLFSQHCLCCSGKVGSSLWSLWCQFLDFCLGLFARIRICEPLLRGLVKVLPWILRVGLSSHLGNRGPWDCGLTSCLLGHNGLPFVAWFASWIMFWSMLISFITHLTEIGFTC